MNSKLNLTQLEERCNPSNITAQIQIDDGTGQRSAVRGVVVIFNARVQFENPDTAFKLKQTSHPSHEPGYTPNGYVQLYVNQVEPTAYEINWYVPSLVFQSRSLQDGLYTFKIDAEEISGYYDPTEKLDGNGDGTPGDDAIFNFHRLYGDVNGDRVVSATDFAFFRSRYGQPGIAPIFSFLGYSDFLDLDEDGSIGQSDFMAFRFRFGMSV